MEDDALGDNVLPLGDVELDEPVVVEAGGLDDAAPDDPAAPPFDGELPLDLAGAVGCGDNMPTRESDIDGSYSVDRRSNFALCHLKLMKVDKGRSVF